jgi:hypothetical protein
MQIQTPELTSQRGVWPKKVHSKVPHQVVPPCLPSEIHSTKERMHGPAASVRSSRSHRPETMTTSSTLVTMHETRKLVTEVT